MTPKWAAANLREIEPASARFVVEYWVWNKVDADADLILSMIEIAKRDRPDWEPPTRKGILVREHPLEKPPEPEIVAEEDVPPNPDEVEPVAGEEVTP